MRLGSTTTTFDMTCEEPWFSFIREGVKPVEGRKGTPKHQKIRIGDFINFSNGTESFKAVVIEIRKYASLADYLEDVSYEKALPGVSSFDNAVRIYMQWSTPEEIEEYGFLGIFIKPL